MRSFESFSNSAMITFSRKPIISFFCLVFSIFFVGAFVLLWNGKPVLVEWYSGMYFGSICDPPFVVLNPLRDRQAELVAVEFLESIKAGNLEVLNDAVSEPERLLMIKEHESRLKAKSWFMSDRIDEKDRSSFNYWIERDYDGTCHSIGAFVEVEKINNAWRVVDFRPGY